MTNQQLVLDLGAMFAPALAAWAGLRAWTTTRRPKPPRCSCGHPPAVHDFAAKKCMEQRRRKRDSDRGGYSNGYEWVRCACVNYDGPPTAGSLVHPWVA